MQPRLFQQRLLELAAEYEALHADSTRARRGSGRSAEAGPGGSGRPPEDVEAEEALAEPAEGGARASLGGDGATSAPQRPRRAAAPSAPGGAEGAAAGSAGGGEAAQRRRDHTDAPSAVGGAEGAVARALGDGKQVHAGPDVVPQQVFVHGTRSDSKPSNHSADAESVTRSQTARHHLSSRPRVRMLKSGSSSRIGEINRTASAQGRRTFKKAVRLTLATSLAKSADVSASQVVRRPFELFVTSHYFSFASASLIIMSTLLIGIETQVLSSLSNKGAGSEQLLSALSAVNYALTFMFAVEVATRIYVLRSDFFLEERVWNCFDMAILLLALVEFALDIVVHISGGGRNPFDNGGMAKMLRLFRLTRLLRLVRTFRQLKPLRMLVHSILFAGRSVLWALLLLLMIVYAFGVILTQAVTERIHGGNQIDDEDLLRYYGDLYRTMLSLWMAVSGGINWNDLFAPLEGTGSKMWMVLFLLYISFVYFFVLNVVTGVFCQNAIEGAQHDLDLSIEAHLREKQVYTDRLRLLFEEMNEDFGATNDGLTAAELHMQMSKPKVQSWFKTLDIDAQQTWKLFKILDEASSGSVTLEAFVEGCLQLRGSATRVDVESLKWEIRAANIRAEHVAARIATLLENIQAMRASK